MCDGFVPLTLLDDFVFCAASCSFKALSLRVFNSLFQSALINHVFFGLRDSNQTKEYEREGEKVFHSETGFGV